ncbi:hypothetical protein [Paralcaligenes ureilyticus]|uniref:Uncharacterized protein n=1 Tax=Paralcaligenes ureilyticus TaxID=627131 RepID=A0A4R3MBZ5_9BURK|nr:hypothetical protein [Paralcaligenes ureilyticus]TCT09779.1 hypothetical protein EDC26_103403 [Paralcaligenes ureilyticus]
MNQIPFPIALDTILTAGVVMALATFFAGLLCDWFGKSDSFFKFSIIVTFFLLLLPYGLGYPIYPGRVFDISGQLNPEQLPGIATAAFLGQMIGAAAGLRVLAWMKRLSL